MFFLRSCPTFPIRAFAVILFRAFAAFTFLQKDSFLHFQYLPSCLRVQYFLSRIRGDSIYFSCLRFPLVPFAPSRSFYFLPSRPLLSYKKIHSFTSSISLRAFASSISFREFAVIPYIFPALASHFSPSLFRGHSISFLGGLYFLLPRFISSCPVFPFANSRPLLFSI